MKIKKVVFLSLIIPVGLGLHFFVFGRVEPAFLAPAPHFLTDFFENFLTVFYAVVFLTAIGLVFKKKLLAPKLITGYLGLVGLSFLVLFILKFKTNFTQISWALMINFGLAGFCFLAGRFLEKQNRLVFLRHNFEHLIFLVFFWVLAISFFYSFFKIFGWLHFHIKAVSPKINFGSFLAPVVLLSFWAAFSEEVIFRLYLFNYFKFLKSSNLAALIISSIFWALAHYNPEISPFYLRYIETFFIGLGLGFLYFWFGFGLVFWVHYLVDLLFFGLPGIYLKPVMLGPFLVIFFASLFFYFKKPKIFQFSLLILFLILFLAPSLPAATLEQFCRLTRAGDCEILEAQSELKMVSFSHQLVLNEKWPKLNIFIRTEKNQLPDFLTSSLKKDFPTLEDLVANRYQMQFGVGFAWLLFDSQRKLKEAASLAEFKVQEKFLQLCQEKFYSQNFKLFLGLGQSRLFLKELEPRQKFIAQTKQIIQEKLSANLTARDKFTEVRGQIKEIEEKNIFLKDKTQYLEKLLASKIKTAEFLDTLKEEILLESLARDKLLALLTGRTFEPAKNQATFKEAPAGQTLNWQVNLEGRYFYSGDNPAFQNMTRHLEPGFIMAVNFNWDLWDPGRDLEQKITREKDFLNFIRLKQKNEAAIWRIQELSLELKKNLENLTGFKEKLQLEKNDFRKNELLFEAGVVTRMELWSKFYSYWLALENYNENSLAFYLKLSEFLELAGDLVKWLEAGYENF